MPASPLPTSPVGSNFTPRREFQRSASIPASFALLAFSGQNLIRLTNFPQATSNLLRSVLESRKILRQFKEESDIHQVKLTLQGKPFSTPKTVTSEAIIVEVLSVVLAHGFHFLSLIDYAKENGDILSMVFSRPELPREPMSTIIPALPPPRQLVPFALSFVSATVIRVVAPPLSLTPSILQAVRKAWPRGVVSERKVGSNGYEFKLKGWGIFAEDTFQEDSLKHALNLLISLSDHGFSLLSSMSFAPGRSNAKDFWLMVGQSDALPSPLENRSLPNMTASLAIPSSGSSPHTRNASLDGRPSESKPPREFVQGHARTATSPAALGFDRNHPEAKMALHIPTHAATDPSSSKRTLPTSQLAATSELPDDDGPLVHFSKNRDSDAVSWDDGTLDEPSLMHTQSPRGSSQDSESTSLQSPTGSVSPQPRLVSPPAAHDAMRVNAPEGRGVTKSLYATIDEAPDLRYTQILYATPPLPRLSPAETVESARFPGGPAPA